MLFGRHRPELGAIRSDLVPSRVGALHAHDFFAKFGLESNPGFAPTIVSLAFDANLLPATRSGAVTDPRP